MKSSRIWLNGYTGKMGEEIRKEILRTTPQKWSLVGGGGEGRLFDELESGKILSSDFFEKLVAKVDVIIDFSSPIGNQHLLFQLESSNFANGSILIGTTGLEKSTLDAWSEFSKRKNCRLLIAPNTSMGILLCLKICETMSKFLSPLNFDLEIAESHHRSKIDSPSGTALILAEGLSKATGKSLVYGRTGKREPHEIGIASLRGGKIYGEHEIHFLGDNEEISIKHKALSRTLFAQGALHLASWLLKQKPGTFSLENIQIDELVTLLNN